MARVQLEHVTKRYDDQGDVVTAVDDMNLDIAHGEFICFVGPSGCGKSTTMETIAGLTIPTEGEIYIGDREVTNLPPKDRGIAMVFQNIALFPHMDVYDNISFGLRLRDYPQDEIDRRVERAADIVQLEGMLNRMPEEMSGGQRQRVAIARAIVREPDVFLMDEPLANLDAKLKVHMRTELQRLHKELDTTIIYVTHDQEEAMTLSDRIAVLDSGQLQQIDPPLTCYNEPDNLFVAGFIGSPSMNFVEGTVTEDALETPNFSLAFNPSSIEGVGVGDDVTLGIRPEDIYPGDLKSEVPDPSGMITARTDILEPMGDEIFAYLLLGDGETSMSQELATNDQLLMSIDPDSDLEEDDEIGVVIDRRNVHLFDSATGEAIVHDLIPYEAESTASSSEVESDD
ncbi:sugar ABC transporter ATP-binding protein [Haloarcula taiwanensis]|uniref:ABC-type D-xylose/L-arabinose transporter n=1 Tax=Haloarcula taiwanensis TaxID=1932004 RepID=A0A2H4ZY31_9EURY|nr:MULTISPECIES: ABC transporter ATP-binding protein [Haloarcula]AUG47382.1 sugar ABC transporter ATP-binding protein [Haloarcula taiwanensis]RLM33948.1 ABC transporter ATP-binding protein [Haloarcula sp. Atlit-120R]RLM42479.1 ABC transporter ATP-binding protein [Haloarcula sp. Atlit-47R]RLM95989.1 ABC transporter ATP-binding protein [Haloarcula sp. Atlit-7R]